MFESEFSFDYFIENNKKYKTHNCSRKLQCSRSCCRCKCCCRGPRGFPGEPGPQGDIGPAGPQGDIGPAGPQGDIGPAGPQGDIGPAGPQGDIGPAGPQGDIGPAGPQGDIGPAGPQGDIGPAGPQGDIGPAGPQGDIGPAGPQGDIGPAGSQGDIGPAGPQGDIGPAGPQGDIGPAGPQGSQGPAGTVGQILGSYDTEQELIDAHPTGNPGDAYYIYPDLYVWDAENNRWLNVGPIAGPQGVQGPQGIQGLQGIQGEPGPQGPEGPMPDLTAILDRLTNLEIRVDTLEVQMVDLENFVYMSEYTEVWSSNPALINLGVGVVRTGITHSFFGIGVLNHVQSLSGTTYTLITASQYPPLSLYVGDATYAQMWLDAPDRAIISMPIKLDSTGIYFTVPSTQSNLPVGTLLRFTVALVLIPSSTP